MKEQEIDSVIIVRDNEAIDPKKSQPKPDSILGDPTWCETCGIWKPDRAHHCRVCDACVLRMDQ
jgi:7-cyano-7-deazaguanine synthase in queuosine biosynthesis